MGLYIFDYLEILTFAAHFLPMKYRKLTKEQFENLHEEFAKFLATQSIDAKEWKIIKADKPEVAEEEMDIFSDIVWEDVLTKVTFLEHFSANIINLFHCKNEVIERIVVKVTKKNINLLEKEGYEWLFKNVTSDAVEILKGSKPYEKERNQELFDLIEKGGYISKGALYGYFKTLIKAAD